jgi:hypothetical protein
MNVAMQTLVRARARERCEYCLMPQSAIDLPFPIDHIIASQHGGRTVEENLALACTRCNLRKGPNIAGLDPDSGVLCRLFNPRQDAWPDHFHWDGPALRGITAIGRTTIQVLGMNEPERVLLRRLLLASGLFDPVP